MLISQKKEWGWMSPAASPGSRSAAAEAVFRQPAGPEPSFLSHAAGICSHLGRNLTMSCEEIDEPTSEKKSERSNSLK